MEPDDEDLEEVAESKKVLTVEKRHKHDHDIDLVHDHDNEHLDHNHDNDDHHHISLHNKRKRTTISPVTSAPIIPPSFRRNFSTQHATHEKFNNKIPQIFPSIPAPSPELVPNGGKFTVI